jgi:hypothetical protein
MVLMGIGLTATAIYVAKPTLINVFTKTLCRGPGTQMA